MNVRLSAASLYLLTCLTACGGGGSDPAGSGDVLAVPPATSGGSGGEGPVEADAIILSENFGDGQFSNFDAADTEAFFSEAYKALADANPNDTKPSFYHPTCCFYEGDDPAGPVAVNLEQMGIVSDNGNPAMLLNTGRFSAGQNRPDLTGTDPKKDSTTGDDVATWGELNLSQPYRISFCVKETSGSRNMQVYVDNNTSSESKSYWGGGSQGSRIFNVPADQLVAGKRVQINVPGDILLDPEATPVDVRPVQVGSSTSFLQFRVEGGSSVIFDDLLVEPQTEDGQADLPACNVFVPATAPDAPDAPAVTAGDGQLTVSWLDVLGATSYDLAYGTADDVASATVVSGAVSPQVLVSLANGTEYFVFLRVNNAVGAGEWSASGSATPVAPLGCNLTAPGDITTSIAWSAWDGCVSPDTSGALVLKANTTGSLSYGTDEILFGANNNGTSTLDTTADSGARSKGDITGVVADADGYPQYFTLIARVDASASTARGLEAEVVFAAPSDQRAKLLLRPDQGSDGRIQLEKVLAGDATAQADQTMTDDYHIYHLSYTLLDPTDVSVVDGNNLLISVYRDGVNISDQFTGTPGDTVIAATGRSGGGGANRMRIGEDSSSGYFSVVDWILWSNAQSVAEMTADDLVGELPASIGELGFYAGASSSAVLSESFDAATDGDASTSDFFTAGYKSISSDAAKPFHNSTGGGSGTVFAGGSVSLANARFSLGDTDPATDTADTDTVTRGDIDLSQPYVVRFDVTVNPNPAADDGKCQVYVDNNTSSSSKSIHGGSSKIFEKSVGIIADGDQATGTVTIASSVGTATSFLQVRCDSKLDNPITIDNLVVEYQ
ncbi:fibronectin type III domain-containing protein [Simiduia agarivorans]|uniref:Pectin methylesterase ce8 n=1 Tax=Simiduia agarivorans (strain DSM 21679 / JCM 13881 / BCRC 17597 / SA1) TaxID=1117647 RepID=K4KJD1_SIMAS|nr:fibronectin type III domain-containing protein [Simiduia agarivorans]AFU99234.1 pectin methylesterase ce8 [Simiduia agarivorans SA1 = DSM 21679]